MHRRAANASAGPNGRMRTVRRLRALVVVAAGLPRLAMRLSSVAARVVRRDAFVAVVPECGVANRSATLAQNFENCSSARMVIRCCSSPAYQRALAASLCTASSVPAFGQYCRQCGSSGASKRSRWHRFLLTQARTQPLQIAHRARVALGQRVGIEMQHGHSLQQLLRGVGPEVRHLTQVARRQADVARDARDFILVASVEPLAALADQLAVTHPAAKSRDD